MSGGSSRNRRLYLGEAGLEAGRPRLGRGAAARGGEIRGIHVRKARTPFDGEVAEYLQALLHPVRSLGLLGRVGNILVAAETGEELLERVANLAVSESGNGDLRA